MHIPQVRLILAFAGFWWLLVPAPLWALTTSAGTGIVIAGEDRLTESGRRTLRALLTQMPPALYPLLEVITVDNAPVAPSGSCAGLFVGPCRINIWSEEGRYEDPFPTDAPEHAAASVFYSVIAHELGHMVSLWARVHRGGWEFDLVAEAGCEPRHYLRSMFRPCFFRDAPQEFTASLINQWLTCSTCTIRLALSRWDRGIRQPMDQVVYLLWLFGGTPAEGPDRSPVGQTLAYEYTPGGPRVTMVSARPWACNGVVEIAGPTFALRVTLDDVCRVTDVLSREGL